MKFAPLLLVFLALATANLTPVQWYQQPDLSKFQLNWLITRDCFRGTFGTLSLFTCPLQHVHLEPFAEVSSSHTMCVVETHSHVEAADIVARSTDVTLLYSDNIKYLVFRSAGASDLYPQLCSSSEFRGAALNVFTVPSHAIHPSTLNVLEGKESQTLDIISDFIARVSSKDLEDIDTKLAFGDPDKAWETRNSYSPQAVLAVNWATKQFEETNAKVSQFPFRADMCNDIVAEFPGANPDEIIVVGSHLDSRSTNNTSPTQIAPGADDNGSGTAINLLFARLIHTSPQPLVFKRTLRLITFCGEEQGLVGSRAIAQSYKANGENIVAMYNADMVGYRPPTSPTVIAFMTGSATPALTASCRAIVNNYLPNTLTGTTSACCSDQQAFFEQGFPAIGLFETNTSGVVYPDYHRSTDTPDKVDFVQVQQFAQAIYSCILTSVL